MDHVFPEVHLGGIRFDLAAIITIVVTSIIVFVLARLAVRNASVTNPTKMQNFLEWVIEFVINLIGTSMDIKKGRPYLMLGIALIMYIFVANLLGCRLVSLLRRIMEQLSSVWTWYFLMVRKKHISRGGNHRQPMSLLQVHYGGGYLLDSL